MASAERQSRQRPNRQIHKRHALEDVQRAYFCPPFDPYMIQGAVTFAVAAKEARLEHIVGLTQWLASPSHPSLTTRQHWLADRLLSMTPGVRAYDRQSGLLR